MELWEPTIKPLRPGLAALPKWRREAVAAWPALDEERDEEASIILAKLIRSKAEAIYLTPAQQQSYDKGLVGWVLPAAIDDDPDRAILDEMARLGREFGGIGKLTFNQ